MAVAGRRADRRRDPVGLRSERVHGAGRERAAVRDARRSVGRSHDERLARRRRARAVRLGLSAMRSLLPTASLAILLIAGLVRAQVIVVTGGGAALQQA